MASLILNGEEDILVEANNLSKKELGDLIDKYGDEYFNDESSISDDLYDSLVEIYERKYEKIIEVGFIPRTEKVKLPRYMGGLDKAQNVDKINSFLKKWDGNDILIQDKVDGVSLYSSCKEGKRNVYTRGKKGFGSDVSHLADYIINDKIDIEVRGELVCPIEKFKKYKGKNPRNLVSGAVNRKHTDVDLLSDCQYIVYKCYTYTGKPSEILNRLYFKKPWTKIMKAEDITFDLLLDFKKQRDKDAEYEIDGLVLSIDLADLEETEKNPHMIAFKPQNETRDVNVIGIDWQPSKYGILTPVVIYEPVFLDGAVLEKATAHNAKYVVDSGIGEGSIVRIKRSGGTIPYIMEVLKKSEPILPECEYEWDENKAKIRLKEETEEVEMKKITNFFKELGCKHMGPETVKKFYDHELSSVDRLLTLTTKDIVKLKIPGIGEKSATRISKGIQKCIKGIHMWTLMSASSLFPNLGEKRLRLILTEYPDILTKEWSMTKIIRKISKIKGMKDKLARIFAINLDKWNEFRRILYGVEILEEEKSIEITFEDDMNLNGKSIVFSGFRDKELEYNIIKKGGFVKTVVSSKTDILVLADKGKGKSKETKAVELDILMMSRDEFVSKIS